MHVPYAFGTSAYTFDSFRCPLVCVWCQGQTFNLPCAQQAFDGVAQGDGCISKADFLKWWREKMIDSDGFNPSRAADPLEGKSAPGDNAITKLGGPATLAPIELPKASPGRGRVKVAPSPTT